MRIEHRIDAEIEVYIAAHEIRKQQLIKNLHNDSDRWYFQYEYAANKQNLRALYLAKAYCENRPYSSVEPNTSQRVPDFIIVRTAKFAKTLVTNIFPWICGTSKGRKIDKH